MGAEAAGAGAEARGLRRRRRLGQLWGLRLRDGFFDLDEDVCLLDPSQEKPPGPHVLIDLSNFGSYFMRIMIGLH